MNAPGGSGVMLDAGPVVADGAAGAAGVAVAAAVALGVRPAARDRERGERGDAGREQHGAAEAFPRRARHQAGTSSGRATRTKGRTRTSTQTPSRM